MYLGQGQKDELVQLLQRQIEQVAGKEDDSAVATERTLRARLIDLFEHELNKPDQAAAQYKAMLQRDPQSLPALSALCTIKDAAATAPNWRPSWPSSPSTRRRAYPR